MQQELKVKKEFDWTSFWKEQGFSLFRVKLLSWYEHLVCLRLFKDIIDVKTCLELGGGPGYLAKLVASKSGYKLTLVENDIEAYKIFKKISNFGNYIVQDFFRYNPPGKFDLVFSFGVIEHYPEKEKRLEVIEIHKKLSRKYVAIFVPRNSFFVRRFFHYPEERGFEKLYTKQELKQELEKAGLKTLKFVQSLHAIGYLCKVG